MKVILTKDVRGVGKKYEVKEVANGYGRNFLIARGMAEAATPEAMKRLQSLKSRMDREEHEETKRREELQRLLQSQHIEFRLRSDKDGHVFGSVTKDMIVKAMREHDWLTKERVEIRMDHPIKQIGDHAVVVDLKHGFTASLKIVVRAE